MQTRVKRASQAEFLKELRRAIGLLVKDGCAELALVLELLALRSLFARGQSEDDRHIPGRLNASSASLNPRGSWALKVPAHSLASLKPAEVRALLMELHDRVNECCPAPIKGIVPPANDCSDKTIERALSVLGSLKDVPGVSSLHGDLPELAIGYAYQLLSLPNRKTAQSQIQTPNKSLSVQNLIAFTQLFTPAWVVDYLVANCVLPQWKGNASRSPALDSLESTIFDTSGSPIRESWRSAYASDSTPLEASELSILDPACGAGNFLLRAFDTVVKMLVADGATTVEAVGIAARTGIAGVDIDPAAVWCAALTLTVRAIGFDPSFCAAFSGLAHVRNDSFESEGERLLGTLNRAWSLQEGHPLSTRYDAIVTNPPYIGRRLISRPLKQALKEQYPDSYHDICTAFIRRSLELLKPSGRIGLITQSSVLYLPSSEKLRRYIAAHHHLLQSIETGPGVFPLQNGEKVDSVLLLIAGENGQPSRRPGDDKPDTDAPDEIRYPETLFIQLRNSADKENGLKSILSGCTNRATTFNRALSHFKDDPHFAFNYCVPEAISRILRNSPSLSEFADVRQGLATSDNERFVRLWWQVARHTADSAWKPYAKGAGSDRWFSPIVHLVKWGTDGAEIKEAVSAAYPYLKGKTHWVVKNESYYFKEGLSFSFVGGRRLSVRHLPPGCVFDVGASAIFAHDKDHMFLMGYLNSAIIQAIANAGNPTINFQVGDVRRLPIFNVSSHSRRQIAEAAKQCLAARRELESILRFPTWGFNTHNEINARSIAAATGSDTSTGAADQFALCSHPTGAADQFTLCSKRSDALRRTLEQLEATINATVLSELIISCSLDAHDQTEIQHWLDDMRCEPALAKPMNQEDFAGRFIAFCILHKFEGTATEPEKRDRSDEHDRSDEQDRSQQHDRSGITNDCGAVHRAAVIDCTSKASIASSICISVESVNWLEQALKCPLPNYLNQRFERDLRRMFKKAPPLELASRSGNQFIYASLVDSDIGSRV